MAYHSLSDFVKALSNAGELIRVDVPVSPTLEITEITDRISKLPHGGKALLFTQTGTNFPLLINALGSEKRLGLALGVRSLNEPATEWQSLLHTVGKGSKGFLPKISLLKELFKAGSYMPRRISGRGACQQVVMPSPDLSRLPILTCWPADGGKFITLPLVITTNPETGIPNLGMYRMQVFGNSLTGMHWHRHKTGANHYEACRRAGKRMPVTVVLGGDPVYTYAATAPLPENIDEFLFAGIIRKKGVRMVKCLTNDHYVPADADFVLEGYVDTNEERAWEGPFGDHTGFYSLADYYPVFHITCITHRKDAIYPATIVGIPPQEDAAIARATERIFLFPIQKALAPEVTDMRLPDEGVAHNLALLAIKQTYPGEAVKVMNALWGAGQMMFTKVMAVFDAEIPLADYKLLLNLFFANFNPADRLIRFKGPSDVLDHSAIADVLGGKAGFDLTGSGNATQSFSFSLPTLIANSRFSIVKNFYTYGLPVIIISADGIALDELTDALTASIEDVSVSPRLLVLVAEASLGDLNPSQVAWYMLGNMDAWRDLTYRLLGQNGWVMVLDGRMKPNVGEADKRQWPNIITMDTATTDLVDKRWNEYFPKLPFVNSPSNQFRALSAGDKAVI